MTDPIKIALIAVAGTFVTATATICAAFINRGKRESAGSRRQTDGVSLLEAPIQNESLLESTAEKRESKQPELRQANVRNMGLSHKEIAAAITNTPPFKREKVAETFIGAAVSWQVHLMSVYRQGNQIHVKTELAANRVCVVTCCSHEDNCAVLQFVPENSLFTVNGVIERVSEWNANLAECTFVVLQMPARS